MVGLLKKLFFDKVRTQKPGKYSLSVLAHGRNRSGVVELVGREPLIIVCVPGLEGQRWHIVEM